MGYVDALEDNIYAFVLKVPAEMLKTLYQNCTKPMNHLKRTRDQHLHETIFRTVLPTQIKRSCVLGKFSYSS